MLKWLEKNVKIIEATNNLAFGAIKSAELIRKGVKKTFQNLNNKFIKFFLKKHFQLNNVKRIII